MTSTAARPGTVSTPRPPRVPMAAPDLTDAERDAVAAVLSSPTLSIGPRAVGFERSLAARVGARHAVSVSSGTAGLHMAVIAAGLADGDVAITTPFSFVASANCLLYERAVPVFVDIDPVTLNVRPDRLEAAVRALKKGGKAAREFLPPALKDAGPTGSFKAVIPVHVFGQPAEMDAIGKVAKEAGVCVIEDSCEAIGATYRGRPAGMLGDVGVFAFYPNKQMTTGEGGMLVTNNAEWNDVFRSLRNQGRDVHDAWLDHSRLGFNYRLDEMSAALGEVQLTRLDQLLDRRAAVAHAYTERLRGIPGVSAPQIAAATTRMSWFVYVVRLAPHIDRAKVMRQLEEAGIPTRAYFSPIHLQPFYRDRFGYAPGAFPEAEAAGKSCMALPFFGTMTNSQVDLVVEELVRVLRPLS